MKSALVLGAGGFIGSHLVTRLKKEGYTLVCGVDLKYPEFSESKADEFIIADLRNQQECESLFDVYNWDEVYQLAADMGGAGYIFTGEHDADLMDNSAKINLNIAKLCVQNKVGKVFYSSSACMYPQEIQRISNNTGLKESDAYPANPDSEYGWEKLFSERLYLAYSRNYGLDVRIARFHNIYGIEGTYKGGREKAPAAMCRKVAEVKTEENIYEYSDGTKETISQKNGEIEVWGDGLQTRSFLYIDECIEGIRRLMSSDCKEPVNIGSDEMVSINELAKMAIDISCKNIAIKNVESKALGVRGRNSDNDFIYSQLGWKPNYPLQKGMEKTFEWISKQVYNNL
jgi:nucleoside-diphosphate-sugar epimerase